MEAITLLEGPVFVNPDGSMAERAGKEPLAYKKHGLAWQILSRHNESGNMESLQLKFDLICSPDDNYVSILQTARASGLKRFPVPYVLTNCHNTLCGVGGTVNEDDHQFALDCMKKYGGIFVPRYRGVLHQYIREEKACGGMMILGSDSHTRYGALGAMGVGEGGGELVKQLLSHTYDLQRPPVVGVVLRGTPRPGVGPMDVGLTLIGATFKNGFVKNKVLEFTGSGVGNLSVDYRMVLDAICTESGCLSSIWCTDDKVREYYALHGREQDYKEMKLDDVACYDGLIVIDLAQVECMMALPFHPSNAIPIREFKENPQKYLEQVEQEGSQIKGAAFSLKDKLKEDGVYIDQALVSGCAGGTFETLSAMADILEGYTVPGSGPFLGVNPASQPVFQALVKSGVYTRLIKEGVVVRSSMCGPCFGVSDIPADGQLSIRQVTRNYPNREGSKPGQNQMAAVILMDARSIAATVRNGGRITAAAELAVTYEERHETYDKTIYARQVADYWQKPQPDVPLHKGPNIAPWPPMEAFREYLLLQVTGVYPGSLTTDELVPSGEATSYRANPEKIADFTLISKDPEYRARAKAVRAVEKAFRTKGIVSDDRIREAVEAICQETGCKKDHILIGSMIAGNIVGDGSSREQAVSNQKVLGGFANLAESYATKRYRSNLINWGLLPIVVDQLPELSIGDLLVIRHVPELIREAGAPFTLQILGGASFTGNLQPMTEEEKDILKSGSLINYYAADVR